MAYASGLFTIIQQMQAQGQSAWPGAGNYIEDVFSTYLYNGTGASQTITNNINLSTNGGLVWLKCRNVAGEYWIVYHTALGNTKFLILQASGGENTSSNIWNNTTDASK